ncbi:MULTISPECIES: hypothetical protein [unclassified Acinetobacter]|uniref:hypothetical protein n=1 Tax=unclassified Acinetobacter TaxID=196816 RepID=UPI0035BB536C
MLLKTVQLADQEIYVFDLEIADNQRYRRRALLDHALTDYFFDHEQVSYIYHQAGKSAQLRLEPLMLQTLASDKPSQDDYCLAISYALPLVAVTWAKDKLAVDMCRVNAFEQMTDIEMQQFCQLYLPELLQQDINSSTLAKHWCIYEAKLKYLGLALQEYSADLQQKLANLAVQSVQTGQYWLSLVQSAERKLLI